MNKLIISIAAGLLSMGTSAIAADMPVKAPKKAAEVSPWDIAFGGALMSDYNFRGISQSDIRQLITGALALGLLAIAADYSLLWLQKRTTPKGLSRPTA